MERTIYNVLLLLNKTVQQEHINLIIKITAGTFEWCIVYLSKMSLGKAKRLRSEIFEHPS